MAASSSSNVVAVAGLGGCTPGVGQSLYGGYTDLFSWRARVGQVLHEKKGSCMAEAPKGVLQRTGVCF